MILENIGRVTIPAYYELVLQAALEEAQERPPARGGSGPSAGGPTSAKAPSQADKEKFGTTPPPGPPQQTLSTPTPSGARIIFEFIIN